MASASPPTPRAAGAVPSSALGWLLAALGWTAFLSFHDMTGGARFEPTDCWVAQTAREMQERGEWLIPRFCGEKRMQKSPGAYWAVMLAARARGAPIDEAATRLPNAWAAVLLVGTIYWLARSVGGERAGVFAGFAGASSMLVLYWSHRGASDLGLAALNTLAVAALWIGCEFTPPGRRRAALWMLGYVAAGLAMLYKMPMPLATVGLPALLYLLVQRRWGRLASGWHVVGVLAFLVVWVPWAAAVYVAEPTAIDKWRVEFVDRFTGELPNVEDNKHWYFYLFYLLPIAVLTVPYTLSVPAALARGWRAPPGTQRDGMRFLLIWFVSLLVFFTVATGKEARYILPALPPLFVLLGCELAAFFDPQRSIAPERLRQGWRVVCVLTPLGLAAGLWGLYRWQRHTQLFDWGDAWRPYAVSAALFAAGVIVAARLFVTGRRNAAFAALVVGTCGMWVWTWSRLMPVLVSQKPFIEFAHQLRERIDPALRARMFQIAQQDPRVVWYSDVRYPRIVDQLELLRVQGGRRSPQRERQVVGEAIIDKLSAPDPVLLVCNRADYVDFLIEAPRFLAAQGRPMPATHLWLQTRIGSQKDQNIVFGNVPPPWPEEPLTPPSARLEAAQAERASPGRPASGVAPGASAARASRG